MSLTTRRATGLFGKAAAVLQWRTVRQTRQQWPLRRSFLAGLLAGVAGMYLFDPRTGRRRRALVRDKFVRFGHDADNLVRDIVPKKLHYISGFSHGFAYRVGLGSGGRGSAHDDDDDHTITDRVLSIAFRELNVPTGQVNVDTVDHVVYLRGAFPEDDTAREIEDRVRKVPGVKGVINLINRPEIDPSTLRLEANEQTD